MAACIGKVSSTYSINERLLTVSLPRSIVVEQYLTLTHAGLEKETPDDVGITDWRFEQWQRGNKTPAEVPGHRIRDRIVLRA